MPELPSPGRCAALLAALALPSCAAGPELPGDVPAPRPLNGHSLPARGPAEGFRFLIAGHLYGAPDRIDAPAATLTAAVDELTALDADLMLALGDVFRVFHPQVVTPTLEVLQRLQMPVFNAPGNHDLSDRAGYEERFGPTFGAFVHGPCLFVQLDTELDPWNVSGKQLQFLRGVLGWAAKEPAIRTVLCCGHKPVFAHRQHFLDVLFSGNGIDGLTEPNGFVAEILPLLARLRPDQRAYWLAGDVGLPRSFPLFYDRDPELGVRYLATGLGDLDRDLVLVGDVDGAGQVDLRVVPLGNLEYGPVDDYGVAFWRQRFFPDGLPPHLETFRARFPR